jgi:hypothetical protein
VDKIFDWAILEPNPPNNIYNLYDKFVIYSFWWPNLSKTIFYTELNLIYRWVNIWFILLWSIFCISPFIGPLANRNIIKSSHIYCSTVVIVIPFVNSLVLKDIITSWSVAILIKLNNHSVSLKAYIYCKAIKLSHNMSVSFKITLVLI